jgi:Na+-driven multidrug efflux pump
MGKSIEALSVRVLLLQMLAYALFFAAQNACSLAERALLAPDLTATVALGLSGTAFCLLSGFTTNVINGCQFIVGQRTSEGDEPGARTAVRQALVLAGGGGILGLTIAGAAGAAAVFGTGPARQAALFLASQGLALGPHLGAAALTGYFALTMRFGPVLLTAVSALRMAIHLVLTWLLVGLLAWSVAGVGVARLGAAVVAVAVALAVARNEVRGLVTSVCRPDRSLLWSMVSEGSVLGLQQVAAGLMVLVLYFRATGAGTVTSAALTLTHSGVYPLLFALAWGSSQAVGAAATLAVGRGDAREFVRVTWLGLGFSAGLAFVLPWGIYALYGRTALALLVDGSPTGSAVLAVSVRCMGSLAIFFVFDFAINYLSALLRAAKEQGFVLKVTVAVAAGFAFVMLALPLPSDVAHLLGAFIVAQAIWALLLLVRVITRWPGAIGRDVSTAPYRWCLTDNGSRSTVGCGGRPAGRRKLFWPLTERRKDHGKATSDRKVERKRPVDHRLNRPAGPEGGDGPDPWSGPNVNKTSPECGATSHESRRSEHRPTTPPFASSGDKPRGGGGRAHAKQIATGESCATRSQKKRRGRQGRTVAGPSREVR